MNLELAVWDPRPADFHHSRAVVEPRHLRPAADQIPRVQARSARRVKDLLARDISQQRQARRPVVIGVEEPALGMVKELIRERLVLGIPPYLAVHAAHSLWEPTVTASTITDRTRSGAGGPD